MENEIVIIDVREPEEYNREHVDQAMNIPLSTFETFNFDKLNLINKSICLYCNSGARSEIAKNMLISKNYHNVYNLGTIWDAKKFVKRFF